MWKVARLTSEISSSPKKTWWLNSFFSAVPSTDALAGPLLASANRPAAPNTGAAFLVHFRLDLRIGKTSRSPAVPPLKQYLPQLVGSEHAGSLRSDTARCRTPRSRDGHRHARFANQHLSEPRASWGAAFASLKHDGAASN